MSLPTDIRAIGATLYFLPVHTRMPLKFGGETVTYVTCARVRMTVRDAAGATAEGGFGLALWATKNDTRR